MLPPALLESVGRLPKLHTLSLANYEPAHMLRHDRTLRLEDVAPIAHCSLLRRLDLSHLCITCHLVRPALSLCFLPVPPSQLLLALASASKCTRRL